MGSALSYRPKMAFSRWSRQWKIAPVFVPGISPGDQILRINGTTTEKMSLQDAINLLRGDPGQKVTLTIFRPSTKETRDYVLQREIIKVASVKDAKILDQSVTGNFKIGYVRITQFNEPTAQELDQKLNELQAQRNAGADR